jgi:dienelactone hydrolase
MTSIHTERLQYRDGETGLIGFLAYDAARTSPCPGVLIVPEAPGINEHTERRARMLAELGYVALGVDVHGGGRFVPEMQEMMALINGWKADVSAWRRRITAALTTLRALDRVAATRVAAIGYCFGGSSVLELARSGAELRAVVSFHGELLSNPQAPEGIRTTVLVCNAAEDPFAPIERLQALKQELNDARVDWQIEIYGSSLHGFTNPASDAAGMPMFGYHAPADRRSWRAATAWLEEAFA